MEIVVRRMRDEEAGSFLEVHHAAVRSIAVRDYPQAVIDDWAPLPIADEAVASFLKNPDNEIRLVAEANGHIVGVGALVSAKHELRACYVAPNAIRKGVGSAIVRKIEEIARSHGLAVLKLDSSLTAAPFYRALGYEVREHGEHVLSTGRGMASVRMEKRLVPHEPTRVVNRPTR